MKKIIILLLGISLLSSCLKIYCEKNADLHRDEECIMILEKEPSTSQAYLDFDNESKYRIIRRFLL